MMDETRDEMPSTELAIQIRNVKGQKEVGVALRRPRWRESCIKGKPGEDTKQWKFMLYSFSDSSELTNLEMLLVQLTPTTCYLPPDLAQESLIGDAKKVHGLLKAQNISIVYMKKASFRDTSLEDNLQRLLGAQSMSEYTAEMEMQLAVGCLACLIDALNLMSDAAAFGCYKLTQGNLSSAMHLDTSAIWSLNLLPDPSDNNASRGSGSVLEILNKGKTPMGRRLLERWIRQPLVDLDTIISRQELVQVFVEETSLRMELLDECMKALPDLEKLSSRLERKKNAGLTDLVSVYDAAKTALPRIKDLLSSYQGSLQSTIQSRYISPLAKIMNDLVGFVELVEEVVDLNSRPILVVDAKHDEELTTLRNEWNDVLHEIENEHRNALDTIGGDIKCEKDKVRGFVFRVINKKEEARISKVDDVHICQVLANGLQFTTTRLKSLASDYKRITSEYNEHQAHLVSAAIDVASTYVSVLEAATNSLAELDVLLGFAHAACHAGSGYCRPQMDVDAHSVVLSGARHPCVELQDTVDFIPNDYELSQDKARFQLITGPNMGGKSTYIRQLGTIAVMAQIGSFVPCATAKLPIFDKLLVRVGAGDLQQRGVSTFMMEMLEAASILHNATSKSLVIIDELGRGTSTYDGFGLAWAISDYLLRKIQCACLFATHFHELTALEQEHADGTFVNKHVTAIASDDHGITMSYQVHDGACLQSFGVHVAKMAGFPTSVLATAKRKSEELEAMEHSIGSKRSAEEDVDMTREKKPRTSAFLEKFAALPMDSMTPEDARKAVLALAEAKN